MPLFLASVLTLLLQAAVGSGGSGATSCCWREPHANLLKGLIDSCPAVVGQQLDGVLRALAAAVQQPALAKSTALGHLLMALLKGCGSVLSAAQVQVLQEVVAATSSFLSKALTTKVAALCGCGR
jgi:Na+/phosphate symporter